MFSKKVCYFFVRPKTKFLEVWIMLGRPIKSPLIKSVMKGSRKKYANLVRVTHRDQVEAPITDWMREAYDEHDALLADPRKASPRRRLPKRRPGRAKNRA